MATVRTKFRPSSVEGKEGTLYFQVIHGRMARQISTGYRIFPSEWDRHASEIVPPSSDDGRRGYLLAMKGSVEEDIRKIREAIAILEGSGQAYTADRVVSACTPPEKKAMLVPFMEGVISDLKGIGKLRLSETYTTTLNSLMRFRAGRDIPLDGMDSDLMTAYEAYLKGEGICPNTSSFYMRCLRAVYNRAVEKGLTTQQYPFRHVYTGIGKTVKRAVSREELRRIRELDLRLAPGRELARDLFLLSFYLRGCAFVDMAYLKKRDLQQGVLSYRRRKTGQRLAIRWERCMQEVVDKYDTAGSPYLLPIIRDPEKDARRQYLNAAHLVNGKLREIGRELGMETPLTMYRARHAWASIARSRNIPITVISEGMGHDSEATTRIYLASLDASVIDKANRLVLESI